jgi:GNAT superfamily N-acetyltransferase
MNTPPVSIRIATLDDCPAILEIFKSWQRNDGDRRLAERYYKALFAGEKCFAEHKVFVLQSANRVVGTIGYGSDRFEVADLYWLGWFYLHYELTNQGNGKFLLNFVLDKLRGIRCRKLYLTTGSGEFYLPARRLYERTGFLVESVLHDYYGKGVNQLIYAKKFTRKTIQKDQRKKRDL